MPLEIASQIYDFPRHNRLDLLRIMLLVSLTMAAMIASLFISGGDADTQPSPSRIVLRINHNITSAHLLAQDYFSGAGEGDQSDILLMHDRAIGYVRVALDGGEIDGVQISPLQQPQLRMEMEKIGAVVGQLKSLTVEFMNQEMDPEKTEKFDQLFDLQYFELVKLTTQFTTSSKGFLQRYKKQLQVLQVLMMVLAMWLVLVILFNSRKAQKEKLHAVSLVSQIEEQRKLAIEGANLGTWDWNIVTKKITFNDRWAEMLGLDVSAVEPSYETWEKLVHPEDLPRVLRELQANLSGKSARLRSEYRMWANPGHWIWIMDLGKVLERDADGNPLRAAGTHLDITELKTIELELRSEKERAQKYLDLAGVMFVALDAQGIVTMINRKGCQILGLPEDYILGRNWMENFVPERIREEIQAVSNNLMDKEINDPEHFINPILTASGSEALIAWHNTTLHDDEGNTVGHLSSGTDITKQRSHEIALEKHQRRLQSLAAQLAITEDRLRQDIASGLHDCIGQNLAALKLSVDLIGLNLDSREKLDISAVQKDLAQASKTIDHIVKETWSLSFQLSPPGLYETGISSALEWLVSRFNEKYSCEFILTTHDRPLSREKDGRGLLFQMVRELMLNAVKHGHASEVEVSLSGAGNYILVSVTDNGTGFDTVSALAEDEEGRGFGLFSIKERLAYISGKLTIESAVGGGTRIVIRFPTGKTELSETEIADEDQNLIG
jgi:PAS domain S-box-containing protein